MDVDFTFLKGLEMPEFAHENINNINSKPMRIQAF